MSEDKDLVFNENPRGEAAAYGDDAIRFSALH